jgi:aryl-alcohol dehydrogenase
MSPSSSGFDDSEGERLVLVTAAVIRAPMSEFTLEQLRLDSPRADEVRVRIVGVGLCHTDLVGAAGAFPLSLPAVFGHEGAGIVEETGSAVRKVKAGDRVAITFRSCGICANCVAQHPAYCYTMPQLNFTGVRTDGTKTLFDAQGPISGNFFAQSSFSTHVLTYERNLVKVPHDVPLAIMGTLGCGVQTGAGAVMRAIRCTKGSSLLVLGGGAVGLSAVLAAVVQSCATIIVVEPYAARRELAQSLGATHVIDPAGGGDLAAAIRHIVPSGVNFAFDTTGIPEVVEAAADCVAPQGVFGFVGVPKAADFEMKLPSTMLNVISRGYTYMGIIEGDSEPDEFIPQLIDLYRAGRFPFDRLIKTYPLSAINEAVTDQRDGRCVKAVLLTQDSKE